MMKRTLSIWLVLMCLCTLVTPALADETPFDPALLAAYAKGEDVASSVSFTEEGSGSSYFFSYDYTGMPLLALIDNGSVSGFGRLWLTLYGFEDTAYADLTVMVSLGEEIKVQKVELAIGDHVYVTDFTKHKKMVEKGDVEGTYYISMPMGSIGLDVLSDLAQSDCAMTIRVYYDKNTYFEIAQGAQEDYALFHEGLIAAHYFDETGGVQPSVRRLLERGLDKNKQIPTTTQHNLDAYTWPDNTATPAPAATPLALLGEGDLSGYQAWKVGDRDPQILLIRKRMYELGYFRSEPDQNQFTQGMVEYLNNFQRANGLPVTDVISPEDQAVLFSEHAVPLPTATPKPEATPRPTSTPRPTATPFAEPEVPLEMTRYGEWGRNRGEPWVKIEVRNTSQQRTVQDITFVYSCRDADGQVMAGPEGELYGYATMDKKVGPGRKIQLGRITIPGYEGVKMIGIALAGMTLDDGTVITIPERDWLFWYFDFK